MRYIKKQQTPPKFTEWKAQANEAWQPFWNSKSTNFQNPQKEIVHKSLLKEQGYICCYCRFFWLCGKRCIIRYSI